MSQARIRQAGPDDALVVAALTLQCALHRGGISEPGFLDRFAAAWLRDHLAHPTWIAEQAGEHAGYLQADILSPLPWPGDGGRGGSLHVVRFFVRPSFRGQHIGEALLRTAAQSARERGLAALQMRPGPKTRGLCERVGLTPAADLMELRLDEES